MFAGRQPRRSSNVRVMQIFHELKPQFPTIPDHIITSCITSYLQSTTPNSAQSPKALAHRTQTLIDLIETASSCASGVQMGRPLLDTPTSLVDTPVTPVTAITTPPRVAAPQRVATPLPVDVRPTSEGSNERISEMNEALTTSTSTAADVNNKPVNKSVSVVAKRPNTLDIRTDKSDFGKPSRKLQLSEKCRDVHKLLNSPIISEKPPRSPLSAKRLLAKHSPTTLPSNKKETVSTPTQTTDTLVNNCPSPTTSVNLSLNVNCQMGLVQSPTTRPKCTTSLEVTPSQPWLNPVPTTEATSPRSFTSVNLTLRPPTSTPQDPIDITSQNSSLTYSTSSYDKEKGLQSRLQITVGPGGGSVSSVRARPRSSYMVEDGPPEMPPRAGSLNNLCSVNSEPPVLLKQQARIDRLRIELRTEKARLVIMKEEVANLEKKVQPVEEKTDEEIKKQLQLEIKHLRCQCEQLALADKEEFYDNIYTGQRGPLIAGDLPALNRRVLQRQARSRLQYQGPQPARPFDSVQGWNCSLCTFLNHPDLDKCEQCEMPRVLHGTAVDSVRVLESLRRSRSTNNACLLANADISSSLEGFRGAGNAARSLSFDANLLRARQQDGATRSPFSLDPNATSPPNKNNITSRTNNNDTLNILQRSANTLQPLFFVDELTRPDSTVLEGATGTVEVINPNLIVYNNNNSKMATPTLIGSGASGVANASQNNVNTLQNMLSQSANTLSLLNLNDVAVNVGNNFNNINTIECLTNDCNNSNGFAASRGNNNMFCSPFSPSYASTGFKNHAKQ